MQHHRSSEKAHPSTPHLHRTGLAATRVSLRLICTALLTATALALTANAASATPTVRVDAPYAHNGTFTRYVMTNAYSGFNVPVRVTLYQYYGGRWNLVNTARSSGERVGVSVSCTGRRTNYSFVVRGEAWSGGVYTEKWSRVVELAC